MAHSEEWARRLVRKVRSPRELLRRRRYRTPVFVRIFLDHVEEIRFRDPRAALKLAKVAPQLALLVPEAAGPDGRREHRENLIRAHYILASVYRMAGRPAVAESEYELALKLADSEALSPLARADLSNRLAALRACQKRSAEALDLVDSAEVVYLAAGDRRRLAEAYGMRGYVLSEAGRFLEALPWHGKALTLALGLEREKPADPADVAALARVVEAARTNMAMAATQSRIIGPMKALGYLAVAHRELQGRRNCLTRHLLQLTEGRLWLRLDDHDRAETRFRLARRGFDRLGAPWDLALCSLELAALYRAGEEWEKLEDLAEETFGRFRELEADHEAIAALSLWLEAVRARKGAAAAIDAARETLEARMQRGGP